MGRKRLSEKDKKQPLKITIKTSDILLLKSQGINISSLMQDLLTNHLKNIAK